MKKKFTAAALALLLCVFLPSFSVFAAGGTEAATASTQTVAQEFKTPNFDVSCKAAVLFEQDTGTVLYEKNQDDRLSIASITKIMTLLLAFEALEKGQIKLEDNVPISEHAYSMGGSQIWVEPGEQFTVDEILRAVVVSSANDAAVALAELVGGSEPVFAEMMNQKARDLGMENTHFVNACGLDAEGHFSSARDVAIMSQALLVNHPQIMKYTTIWMDSLRGGKTELVNTNKLLKTYNGITGLKTGTTSGAGICISASATRNGTNLIAVVLGSNSSAERFEAAKALLNYGFANYEVVDFPSTAALPRTIAVQKGVVQKAELTLDAPTRLLLQKGAGENLFVKVELPDRLVAGLLAGQEVGKIYLMSGSELIATYPVLVKNAVEKMNFKAGWALLTNSLFIM